MCYARVLLGMCDNYELVAKVGIIVCVDLSEKYFSRSFGTICNEK